MAMIVSIYQLATHYSNYILNHLFSVEKYPIAVAIVFSFQLHSITFSAVSLYSVITFSSISLAAMIDTPWLLARVSSHVTMRP